MKALHRILVQTLMFLTLLVPGGSFAEMANAQVAGPRWVCWYNDDDLTLICRLGRKPNGDFVARAAAVAQTIDRRLSGLVRTIWGSPELLAGRRINIPLWNVPHQMDFARQLAEAVMCGGRLDCGVTFDSNADGLAPVRAAALETGASEAEVSAGLAPQGLPWGGADAGVAAAAPERRAARRRRDIDG